jgi:hypothetical protein
MSRSGDQAARSVLPDPLNMRRHERVVCDKPVRAYEIDESGTVGPGWEARLTDISRGGMGLTARRMVHNGRGVFVEWDDPDLGKLYFGIVRQADYREGIGYTIGLQFEEVPNTKHVVRWLHQRGHRSPVWRAGNGSDSVYPPPPPSRASPRTPG